MLFNGQWINQKLMYQTQAAQYRSEQQKAEAQVERLDRFAENSLAFVTSTASGLACGAAGAAVGGPIGAGAAGSACAGAVNRFVRSQMAGNELGTSVGSAFEPKALTTDIAIGAVFGGVTGYTGSAAKSLASETSTALKTEVASAGAISNLCLGGFRESWRKIGSIGDCQHSDIRAPTMSSSRLLRTLGVELCPNGRASHAARPYRCCVQRAVRGP